jgi:hypothetical protein
MSARFSNSGTTALQARSPPFSVLPFSIGCWFRPITTPGTMNLFAFANAATNCSIFTGTTAINFWNNSTSVAIGTIAANRWYYIIARWVTATSGKASILDEFGAIQSASSAAGAAITATSWVIGGNASGTGGDPGTASSWDGDIQDFWITNTDVQPGGAALDAWLLRYVSQRGPFAVPSIAPYVIDYQALRSPVSALSEAQRDSFISKFGRPVWMPYNGGPTLGQPAPTGMNRGPIGTRSSLVIPV